MAPASREGGAFGGREHLSGGEQRTRHERDPGLCSHGHGCKGKGRDTPNAKASRPRGAADIEAPRSSSRSAMRRSRPGATASEEKNKNTPDVDDTESRQRRRPRPSFNAAIPAGRYTSSRGGEPWPLNDASVPEEASRGQPTRIGHTPNLRAIELLRPAAPPMGPCPCCSRPTRLPLSCAPRGRRFTPWLSEARFPVSFVSAAACCSIATTC